MKQKHTYYYRGMIERGKNYRWCKGYSQNGETGLPQYPWITKTEARKEAALHNATAVFTK